MRFFGVLLVNALTLALVVGGILWSGESPRVGVYVFYFNYVLRLLTLFLLHSVYHLRRAADRNSGEGWKRILGAVTRRPHPGQASHPVRYENQAGPPAGIGGYLIVMGVTGGLSFILMHVGDDQELHVPWPGFLEEIGWAVLLAPVGWLQDLWDRRIVLEVREPIETNLGYNSSEASIAAVAVLTGGVASGMVHDPWYLAGALLGFRHLFAVWEDLAKPPAAGDELPVLKD